MPGWLTGLAELGKIAGGALLDRIPVIRARRARRRERAAIERSATEVHHDPVAEAIAREREAAARKYRGTP